MMDKRNSKVMVLMVCSHLVIRVGETEAPGVANFPKQTTDRPTILRFQSSCLHFDFMRRGQQRQRGGRQQSTSAWRGDRSGDGDRAD